jgi:hypothetical protein
MTTQRRKLLRARIALSLRDEYNRQPTTEELDRWTRFAAVLFKTVGSVIAIESNYRKSDQMRLWA